MSEQDWLKLRATLLVTSNKYSLAPRSHPDVFDYAERALNFKLPRSYCDFVKVFGPGTLAHEYRIAAPGFPDQYWAANLLSLNEMTSRFIHGREEVAKRDDHAAQKQLIYFCTTGGKGDFGWMPDETLTPAEDECAVYVSSRGDRGPVRVADTFPRFITEYCLTPLPSDGEIGGDAWHLRFDPENDLVALLHR